MTIPPHVKALPAHIRVQVDAAVHWLHYNLRGIVDRVELAPHVDGAWCGRFFVITPDP